MILKSLKKASQKSLINQSRFEKGFFDKVALVVRSALNKMSNEDNRSFDQTYAQNQLESVDKNEIPQTPLAMEKKFIETNQLVSALERGRLSKIDEILGTKTYFHEIKPFEERLDSDHVMIIQDLYQKKRPASRKQLTMIDPQTPQVSILKNRRKFLKAAHKLKTYPSGNPDLINFSEQIIGENKNESQNEQLIRFLGEEELFTRFGLSDIQLTIESIQKERLICEEENRVIEGDEDEQNFIIHGKVYFRPHNLMSIYRIDQDKFTKSLENSIDSLANTLKDKEANLEEVINLTEIYDCLKEFYFDERVSEYISKIENNTLNYLLSKIEVSPDGEGVFIVIDLLGDQKEFVGLFKTIKHGETGIGHENVIFNFKPNTVLKNKGELYFVQRNEEGLYTELIKTKFNCSSTQKIKVPETNTTELETTKNWILETQSQRQQHTIYKCKPYKELSILTSKSSIFMNSQENFISHNILLEESEIGSIVNNQIFMIQHLQGLKANFHLQLITANNDKIQQILGNNQEVHKNGEKVFSKVFELVEIGFLIVRYLEVQEGEYLKYGNHEKYAKFVTLLPYASSQHLINSDFKNSSQIEDKSAINSQIEDKNTEISPNPRKSFTQNIQIDLPRLESGVLFQQELSDRSHYTLDLSSEKVIFVCPENQFIYDMRLKYTSFENVYMLMNLSFESVYNRNSLYTFPLRKGVNPYSLFLDGHQIEIMDENTGSGKNGIVELKVKAPLLPIYADYTLWKKEINERPSSRIYHETITVKEEEEDEIIVKLISNKNFIKRGKKADYESQPIILYLPDKNSDGLDEIVVKKLLEKGVILMQIIKCRGIFGTNMIDLIKGSRSLYNNYIEDLTDTIIFIKENIGERVGIYAEGPGNCFASLMLNIYHNGKNELFDCSVLHEGVYDISEDNKKKCEHFFGSNLEVFNKLNPLSFKIYNPTKNQLQPEDEESPTISSLSNMVFSSLALESRSESRRFINKLRCRENIEFDSVYLKEFDVGIEKDEFNLSYLYKIMTENMQEEYKQVVKAKREEIGSEGEAASKDEIRKEMQRNKNKEQYE